MTNTPRDPKQNQNANDKGDKANINDPNRAQDNDGAPRQQEAQQARQGQQGQNDQNPQTQSPQPKRPDDQRKPQQR